MAEGGAYLVGGSGSQLLPVTTPFYFLSAASFLPRCIESSDTKSDINVSFFVWFLSHIVPW